MILIVSIPTLLAALCSRQRTAAAAAGQNQQ
jgi:hypothetical protein